MGRRSERGEEGGKGTEAVLQNLEWNFEICEARLCCFSISLHCVWNPPRTHTVATLSEVRSHSNLSSLPESSPSVSQHQFSVSQCLRAGTSACWWQSSNRGDRDKSRDGKSPREDGFSVQAKLHTVCLMLIPSPESVQRRAHTKPSSPPARPDSPSPLPSLQWLCSLTSQRALLKSPFSESAFLPTSPKIALCPSSFSHSDW